MTATTADGSSTSSQDTYYISNDDVNGSRVTDVVYPESTDSVNESTWVITGTDHVSIEYDRLGRKTKVTDQLTTVHEYSYSNTSGRLVSDAVTGSVPAGVDDAIRRIELSYDTRGRVQKVSSYDAASSGNVKNEIKYTYTDDIAWGQVTKSEQDHAGAVGGGEPAVDYTYETGADGGSASGDNVAEYFRLDKVTCPNGPSSTRRDVY